MGKQDGSGGRPALEAPPHRRRILVADDEPGVLEIIRRVLEDAGHLVSLAFDGEQASRRIDSGVFDAVICDLNMPRRNGIEVYRHWRAANPEHEDRFVLMMGDGELDGADDLPGIEEIAGLPRIPKPFPLAAVLRAVDSVLGES